LLAAQAGMTQRKRRQQRQRVQVQAQRVGAGHRIAARQPRPREPVLFLGMAHDAVDGHALRVQQVAQGAGQGDVEDVTVAVGGEFGEMVDDMRHVDRCSHAPVQLRVVAGAT